MAQSRAKNQEAGQPGAALAEVPEKTREEELLCCTGLHVVVSALPRLCCALSLEICGSQSWQLRIQLNT